MDNEYIGFAFDATEVSRFSHLFWKKATGEFDPNSPLRDGKFPINKLPVAERYSGRYFTLKDIFETIDTTKPTLWLEMPWFYDISSWEKYCTYIASPESKKMLRPKSSLLKYRTWKKVGVDDKE